MKGGCACIGLLSLLLVGCSIPVDIGDQRLTSLPTVDLVSPDRERRHTVHVEVADDPAEHARGLMERKTLPAGSGMLFIFNEEAPRSFWMKNTLIPLDIIFFDAEKRFISMTTMEPCSEDPCASYLSGAPAQYALEVPAGAAREYGIGDDWRLEWVGM